MYFFGDPIEKHSDVLIRIASILKNNPDAELEIKGYTSGLANEQEGLTLAKKRAEEVTSIFKGLIPIHFSNYNLTLGDKNTNKDKE